jgi:hypothetical protein
MVYFVQAERSRLVKIGQSTDVKHRLSELQHGNPDKLTVLAVIPDKHFDGEFHIKFRDCHFSGEWFEPTPELMEFIQTLRVSEYTGMSCFARVQNVSINREYLNRFPQPLAPAKEVTAQSTRRPSNVFWGR